MHSGILVLILMLLWFYSFSTAIIIVAVVAFTILLFSFDNLLILDCETIIDTCSEQIYIYNKNPLFSFLKSFSPGLMLRNETTVNFNNVKSIKVKSAFFISDSRYSRRQQLILELNDGKKIPFFIRESRDALSAVHIAQKIAFLIGKRVKVVN